ncbi:ABC transporter ATP-binding protein [Rhodococcus gannanensis]|uniref:ABC transporter ATP-binding protein n=1 Tax=Rhodococcus gannanensis TaxID=1960308 RepID=A0ABW4PAV1_9NOCA
MSHPPRSGDHPPRRSGGGGVLRRTVLRHRGRLAVGTALLCVHQLAETAVPIAIGVIVAQAIEPGSTTALVWSIAGLAALFTVLTAAWRIGARLIVRAMQDEAHSLRVEVARRILDPRGVRTDLRSGELLTVATSDAEREAWVLDVIPRVVAALTAAIASAVALLLVDVTLGLAVLVGTPVILGAMQLAAPLITRRVTDQQAAIARVSAMATDVVAGLRPLRGLGAEGVATGRYRDVSEDALVATLRAARSRGIFLGVSVTVSALLAVGVAGLAGWFALSGRIGVGELITVVGLSQFIIEPLGMLSRTPGDLAAARASADRLALVLDAEPMVPEGTRDVPDGGGLALRDVHFRSLDGLTVSAEPGALVGVLARRPHDGEALALLLAGHVPPSEYRGAVEVGGVALADLEHSAARRTLLAEPHHTDLFAGTVESNIRTGGGTGGDDLREPLVASAASEVVDSHPQGTGLVVSDRGANLSGGQRQRVALARALARRAPILVLHDPTTAVDAVTEQAIADGIADFRHGDRRGDRRVHTTVLITSSPALLAVADRVVVLDEGRVVAEGTHAELAAADDDYRRGVLR